MEPPNFRSITDQVVEYLRKELFLGRWRHEMPGQFELEKMLGVSRKTIELALNALEKEGLIVAQGVGKKRKINLSSQQLQSTQLRVAVLNYVREDWDGDYTTQLRHQLRRSGHEPIHPGKSLFELGMNPKRIARLVQSIQVDAWVVVAGSKEVLSWFVDQGIPVFGLFGRIVGLPIAGTGPDKAPAMAEAVRHLAGMGHHRIARFCHRQARTPKPNRVAQAYLDELEAVGIEVSNFHMPDWKESKAGFIAALDSLFELTPPTALILDGVYLYMAAQHYLSARGLRVPQDVSLVCEDGDSNFQWCEPSVAHIHWEVRPVVRRAVRWANRIASGKTDLRQSLTKAEFVAGGTVGVAPNH